MENISKVDSTEKIRKSKSKKKKKNKNKQVENATIISEEQGESFSITTTEPSTERPPSQSKQQKKTRPNFFLGFRIREQSIIEKASTLQEEIREKIPDIATCLIKPHTFHVTLMVMYLADEEGNKA
jgi:hypothetical protein